MRNGHPLTEGKTHENVLLELCLGEDGSALRLRPVSDLPADIRVEFPEKRLASFPPGTFFRATVQVCQEHWPQTGKPKGQPYLVASNIYAHRMEVVASADKPIHCWDKIA